MTKRKTNSQRLYPIYYKGLKMYEKHCDDVFVAFYNDKESLTDNMSVYTIDGMYVFPDGEIHDTKD